MIYRYIYKITCTKGSFKGKYYYGQHTTKNLNDRYITSGHKIGDYIKKYPNDYIREIIAFYDTEEELNKAEYDIIHPVLGSEDCLNITEGGYYGKPSYEARKKISEKNKISCKGELNGMFGKTHSEKTRKLISEARKGVPRTTPVWNKGMKNCFSEEILKHLSDAQKRRYENIDERQKQSERLKGKEPWNKGIILNKIWMHYKDEKPIYVDLNEVDTYLNLGYIKGRGKLNIKNHRTTSPIKGKHLTTIDGKRKYV